MKLVNLGCGNRFHEDWINYDFNSSDKSVISHDLTTQFPIADNSVDAVFSSHVLEHFTREEGLIFINEIHRVLKINGIVRLAVPDLEVIAQKYLEKLASVKLNPLDKESQINYDWSLIELMDQHTRTKTGGEVIDYFKKYGCNEYVIERWGNEAKEIYYKAQKNNSITQKLNVKEWIKKTIYSLLGFDLELYKVGCFINKSGERHKSMYDSYSLSNLLIISGFRNVKIMSPNNSIIPEWAQYNLEVKNGDVIKPDSLIIEAIKI